MKEFSKTQKVTYNLMSFTAYKALVLFSLLSEGPKSYDEICDYFYNKTYLNEKISIDTLRVYINSLKRIGCEVKRVRGTDKISRYFISASPFELKLTVEQLQSAVKVYKSIVKNIDIRDLISIENLFEKIGSYIDNQDFIADIKKVSMLKDVDKNILNELIECCERNEEVTITYNSPNSGEKQIEILADKINIENGKIYLYGFGFEYMQYGSFLLSRIKKIDDIKPADKIPENFRKIKVVYELKCNPDYFTPEDNEKIIKKTSDKLTIEVQTSNEFLLKQRLLGFGADCKILEPDDFKNSFIQLLKNMKAGYYCD